MYLHIGERNPKPFNHGCLPEQRRAQLACARAGLAPARGDGQGSAVAEEFFFSVSIFFADFTEYLPLISICTESLLLC